MGLLLINPIPFVKLVMKIYFSNATTPLNVKVVQHKSKAANFPCILHLCYDIIIATPATLFIATANPTNQKENEVTRIEWMHNRQKILYILPITIDDDDDVVINEHKKFYWVSKGAIHRSFNNVVKGPRNFIYWLFLCEKEMCALFLWLKVHNSLFKWTFLICSCLYPAQL